MLAQETEFDRQLKRIGDLYEEGKDCLNSLQILEDDRTEWSRVYEIIRELRDIAAVSLKGHHEIKEN